MTSLSFQTLGNVHESCKARISVGHFYRLLPLSLLCSLNAHVQTTDLQSLSVRQKVQRRQHGCVRAGYVLSRALVSLFLHCTCITDIIIVFQVSEDEQAIREELLCLAARYRSIGITLGLPSGMLDTIRCDYACNCEGALGQVIRTWLKQSYNVDRFGPPSWRSLVKVVYSSAGGNDRALAKKIAAKHKRTVECQYVVLLLCF